MSVKNYLHSNWLFGIILDKRLNRDKIILELLELGIETRPFFFSLHTMPPYLKYKASYNLENSKKLSQNGLSLPTSWTEE